MNQLLEPHQLVAILLVGLLVVSAAQVVQLRIEREEYGMVFVHLGPFDAAGQILRLH